MYKALIIGAGMIASGFDEPESDNVLTHAHAYIKNPNIELLGFYDTDYKKAEHAAKKWGVSAFYEPVKADIISICTPDKFHLQSVLEIAKLSPKIIFLEKPVCQNLSEYECIKQVKIPVLVNYSRSFSVNFQKLAKRIKLNEFGNFQTGTAYYGKGFIHNGSHLINLFNLLIGQISKVETFDEFIDFYSDDKTKSAVITFENGKKLIMQGNNCNNFTIFECDLIFEKARIRIINSGFDIEIYAVKNSEKFKGYKNLVLSETIKTDLDYVMQNAIDNIVDFLNGNSDLKCTLEACKQTICV